MTIASGKTKKKMGRPGPVMHETLAALSRRDGWSRPMDIGATDGSHHSATLRRLCANGLAERQRRNTLINSIGGFRGSWEYRITRLGRKALVRR